MRNQNKMFIYDRNSVRHSFIKLKLLLDSNGYTEKALQAAILQFSRNRKPEFG
jgi:hypothetical protein